MAELDEIAPAFERFMEPFQYCFARKEVRKISGEYVRALITQTEERCNAENLAEVVPISPRSLQRFLTESPWPHQCVIDCLQHEMADRLNHPEGVWVIDESGFVKQGKKSAGVARQYCGTLGKTGNCQVGVFLAYVTPSARLLVEKELYLPKQWTEDPKRCEAAGIPESARSFATKQELGVRMLLRAKDNAALQSRWVTADDLYGESPWLRHEVAQAGFLYVLEVPRITPAWPVEVAWQTKEWSGKGRPPKARPDTGMRKTCEERAAGLKASDWQEIEVATGAQGPRRYLFARERVRESIDGEPQEEVWLLLRRNLDGSEPRYYFSNAPLDTPIEVMAKVACLRWSIETEFEETKGHVGLDEYEVRSWSGWHHHITLCFLANAFLLTLQQDWEKKSEHSSISHHPSPSLPFGARGIAAGALVRPRTDDMASSYSSSQRAGEDLPSETTRERATIHVFRQAA